MLNDMLLKNSVVTHYPCESFDLDELTDMYGKIWSLRNRTIGALYESSGSSLQYDNRALRYKNEEELKDGLEYEKEVWQRNEHNALTVRAGKCCWLVMLYVHHLD